MLSMWTSGRFRKKTRLQVLKAIKALDLKTESPVSGDLKLQSNGKKQPRKVSLTDNQR